MQRLIILIDLGSHLLFLIMALEMPAVLAAITDNLSQQTIFPSFITANFMAIYLHVLVKPCKSRKFLI